MVDSKEIKAVKERFDNWSQSVNVLLNEEGTGYIVKGDERVPEEIVDGKGDEHPFVLPRVTGLIDSVIHKGDGFYTRLPLIQAIEHMKTQYPRLQGGTTVEEYEDILMEASGMSTVKMEESASFGIRVHAILEDIYNSGMDKYRHDSTIVIHKGKGGYASEYRPAIDAWYEWMENSGLHPIASEQGLYYHDESSSNAPISFAGKADLIAIDDDGVPVIVDYKTGKQHMNHALQLSAYSLALSYCGIGKFLDTSAASKVRAIALYLPKEEGTDIKVREVRHTLSQQQVFLYVCKLRQWQAGRSKWASKRG